MEKHDAPLLREKRLGPEPDRDAWCTKPDVWRIFLPCANGPAYDLDPCSNDRSTVPARRAISLPEDGLQSELERGEVGWLNPPYSRGNPEQWFRWATEQAARGGHVVGVIRSDTSTGAWCEYGPVLGWSPPERWEFDPPPGADPSKANMVTVGALWTESQDVRAIFTRAVQGRGGYMMVRGQHDGR